MSVTDEVREAAQPAVDDGAAAQDAEAARPEEPPPQENRQDARESAQALGDALQEAQGRIAELEDRALRAAAEAENIRRRADRSIENARKFALEKFVADLLPAVDSFERAADALAAVQPGADAVRAMDEGLKLSLKLLSDALERQGIEAVDPLGAPFDPALHEAMSMVDNAEAEPNTVVQVFQKGYTVNGRLARAARVIVARAPQKPPQQQPRNQTAQSNDTADNPGG